MGLFRKFVDSYNQARNSALAAQQTRRAGVVKAQPWNVPTPQFEVVIDSDNERKAYIYDPHPLAGVSVGQEIIVEVFRGYAYLVSTITGYDIECGNDSCDCALMYNGQIFGSASLPADKILLAAQNGYAIKLKAKANGVLPQYGNLLDLSIYCPSRFYLHDYIPSIEDRPFSMRDNVAEYSLTKDYEKEPLLSRDKWNLKNVKIEYIPLKKGSKAKPHIGVYMEDGTLITDATVQRRCYSKLASMMENYTSFSATAERVVYEDREAFYKLTIIGS